MNYCKVNLHDDVLEYVESQILYYQKVSQYRMNEEEILQDEATIEALKGVRDLVYRSKKTNHISELDYYKNKLLQAEFLLNVLDPKEFAEKANYESKISGYKLRIKGLTK